MRRTGRVGQARRVGRAGLMSCARRAGRRARARNRPENGHETAFWHAKRRFSSVSGALELPRSEKPQVADRLSKSAQATSCQNAVSWPKTSDSATRPEPNAKLRTRCARTGAREQRCKGGSGKKEEGRARGEDANGCDKRTGILSRFIRNSLPLSPVAFLRGVSRETSGFEG